MHTRLGVYRVVHNGPLLITWHRLPPLVERAVCDLWTLPLSKCRQLGDRLATVISLPQAHVSGTVFSHLFALLSQCTLSENFCKRFHRSVPILDLNSVCNIVRRSCSIFSVRRFKFVFLHFIKLHIYKLNYECFHFNNLLRQLIICKMLRS